VRESGVQEMIVGEFETSGGEGYTPLRCSSIGERLHAIDICFGVKWTVWKYEIDIGGYT
jgi:hypothetical protein